MNRRRFLSRTGGTAAAIGVSGAVVGLSRQVKAAKVGANDTIRVGVIGSGGQGQFDISVFLENGDVAIPLVCDVNQRRADKTNRKLLDNKAKVVEDYHRVLDRKDIDAVLIATPDHWHAIPAISACMAGKDVYVEKPMSWCIAEGRRMVQAARKYDRVVQVGTQQLRGPLYQEVAELVQGGKIGKVTHVRTWNTDNRLPGAGFPADSDAPEAFNWDFWLGPAPAVPYNRVRASGLFRMFWDYAGGTMTDWGTHHMTSVLQIMGEDRPKSVMATGGKYAIKDIWETPDTLNVLWEFPSNWTLTYTLREANAMAPDRSDYGIVFHGTEATVYLDRSGYEIIPEKGKDRSPKTKGTPRKNNFMPRVLSQVHIRNFLDCVKSRKRPIADVEVGQRGTSVAHLGNVALRSGHKIIWDAEKETTVGDPEAAKLLTRQYRKPYVLPEI